MKELVKLLVLQFLFWSCGKEVEKTYYDSGELRSEYEVVDGRKNGYMKEYYESNGQLMRYSHWINDTLDGKSEGYYEHGVLTFSLEYKKGKRKGEGRFYTETGKIKEVQYYDEGHLKDVKKYTEDGRRSGKNMPLFHLSEDTTHLGNELVFTMRMGNIIDERYRKGAELIIASQVTKYGDPLDTIALFKSDSNHFEYRFKATELRTEKGKGYVRGCLQYFIPIDTLPGAIYHDRYGFVQPYWIKDTSVILP